MAEETIKGSHEIVEKIFMVQTRKKTYHLYYVACNFDSESLG